MKIGIFTYRTMKNKIKFTSHELGFIWSSLNCLRYEDNTTEPDEIEYNNKIDNLLKKIEFMRAEE